RSELGVHALGTDPQRLTEPLAFQTDALHVERAHAGRRVVPENQEFATVVVERGHQRERAALREADVLPEFHAVSVQAIEVRFDGSTLPIVGPSGAVHRARPSQRATPGATVVVGELLFELDASVQRNAEEAILSAHL